LGREGLLPQRASSLFLYTTGLKVVKEAEKNKLVLNRGMGVIYLQNRAENDENLPSSTKTKHPQKGERKV
jgi:hypothetical protein